VNPWVNNNEAIKWASYRGNKEIMRLSLRETQVEQEK
jgi:hypothetical protein